MMQGCVKTQETITSDVEPQISAEIFMLVITD